MSDAIDGATQEEFEFHVGGTHYKIDDLNFEEQRELRSTVRELAGDPTLNLLFSEGMDRLPTMHWIITRRTNPEATLEESLALKPDDLLQPVKTTGRRPTKAAAKKT